MPLTALGQNLSRTPSAPAAPGSRQKTAVKIPKSICSAWERRRDGAQGSKRSRSVTHRCTPRPAAAPCPPRTRKQGCGHKGSWRRSNTNPREQQLWDGENNPGAPSLPPGPRLLTRHVAQVPVGGGGAELEGGGQHLCGRTGLRARLRRSLLCPSPPSARP